MLKRQKGQGMVEFALILPVLLLIILAIIETALIFQGYLTVQHAAREAARWAVTYNPEKGMNLDGSVFDPTESDPEYWARRVDIIKQVAVQKAVGLRIDDSRLGLTQGAFDAYRDEPNFYGVEVWGFPSFETPGGGWTDADLRDHPGLPGLPVRVRVTHNVELLDPLFRAIVPRVRVVAQTEMINEGTQSGFGNVAPPSLPPAPPLPSPGWEPGITDTPEGGGPTETPEGTPVETPTPTSTLTPTPTNTPTATPSGPFITASEYQVIPTQLILVDVIQHAAGEYQLHWVNGSYDLVISPALQVDAGTPVRDIQFTIPSDNQGNYYLETRQGDIVVARSAAVEVVPPPPDLVVRSIGVPEEIRPNEEMTVTVEVQNLTAGFVSGYFDVDLYVDPDSPPLSNRPGASKQWLLGIDALGTEVITHVVTLYGGGPHELWAKVDTSDWVPDELDETNNLFGPLGVTAGASECSDMSDRFNGPDLDSKWSSAMIGYATVHEMTIDEAEGTLSIQTNGTGLWDSRDDGSTLLYQPVTGDFVATLRVVQGLDTNRWAKVGLMARASTANNSALAMVMDTRDEGVQFGYRRAGDIMDRFASDAPAGEPVWLRLVRTGDSFAAYYSANGTNWVVGTGEGEDGGVTVDMPDTILIGIAASAYSTSVATGIVDDFEVCPLDASAETCQVYSDDFDDGVVTDWIDVDVPDPVSGSGSTEGGGTITISGDGTSIWGDDDSFHYTYKPVSGNFVATLRINTGPTQSGSGKGGLMVRSGTAADSAHVTVSKRPNHVQFDYRSGDGNTANTTFGDNANVGLPVWVRVARNGNAFSAFYSTNGEDWTYGGSAMADMPDEVLIGMALSAYDVQVDSGNFDDFVFCAGEASAVSPPIRPPEEKPPGLKECSYPIRWGDFEASTLIINEVWTRSADTWHTSNQKHSGNFSMAFRASVGPRPEYRHMDPWAYQSVPVPGDVLPSTTGTLIFWQYIEAWPGGSPSDPDDRFYMVVRDSNQVTQSVPIQLAQGDTDTPVFQQEVISVENYLLPSDRFVDLASEEIELYFYTEHDGELPGTYFYMDDVRLDICTTQPIPAEVPGTASVGGLVEVVLAGVPTKMGDGIEVIASRVGGEMYRTKTIHDSTYHFYNLPPGNYVVQAFVSVGGYDYWNTVEVELVADERNYAVDMLLQ